jgi:hypothetical protein
MAGQGIARLPVHADCRELRFGRRTDQGIELGHQSRLVSRGVVFVNNPFGSGTIERAHRIPDCQGSGFRIAIGDEPFRSADKGPSRGSEYSVTLPLSLGNTGALCRRLRIGQTSIPPDNLCIQNQQRGCLPASKDSKRNRDRQA